MNVHGKRARVGFCYEVFSSTFWYVKKLIGRGLGHISTGISRRSRMSRIGTTDTSGDGDGDTAPASASAADLLHAGMGTLTIAVRHGLQSQQANL